TFLVNAVRLRTDVIPLEMMNSVLYRQIFASEEFNANVMQEIQKGISNGYILLLDTLCHLQKYKEALIVADTAINRKELPNQDAFYFYAGLALLGGEQNDKAFVLFNKSIEVNPDNPLAYFYLARMYEAVGRSKESAACQRKYDAIKQKG